MMLQELQKNFYQAILQPPQQADTSTLDQLAEDERIAKANRLNIYRINVMASLITNFEAVYPVVALIAKPENFRYAASIYIRNNLPTVPQLSAYGEGFIHFLENFKPAQSQPVIAEMAKLEWLRNEALFAADSDSISLETLQSMPMEQYPQLTFKLHPALRLIASSFQLHHLWQGYQTEENYKPAEADVQGESYTMVFRPAWKVEQAEISAGEYAFLTTLAEGQTLENAAGQALGAEPDMNFQEILIKHLTLGTFAAIGNNAD